MKIPKLQLILFLTGGNSLRTWESVGSLNRELKLYKALSAKGVDVHIVSYGGPREIFLKKALGDIKLTYNFWRLPMDRYIVYLGKYFLKKLKGPVLFKSNQVRGAEVPIKISHSVGKKNIVRLGYLPSINSSISSGNESDYTKQLRALEEEVFSKADHIVVTTPQLGAEIIKNYRVGNEKISIVPNFVDTQIFKPQRSIRKKNRICCVAKLGKHKNLELLFESIKGLDVTLDLVGEGPERGSLKLMAERLGLKVNFIDKLFNEQLPMIINQSYIFVLPSKAEGHPKALIEAMGCGVAVIGTNVFGIRHVIDHKINGILCESNPESMRASIVELLGDQELMDELGSMAREYIVKNYSFELVLNRELDVLKRIAY